MLKVLVAKMRLDNDGVRSAAAAAAAGEDSPPKRLSTAAPAFDAPSPNGATVACVIVSYVAYILTKIMVINDAST